ncbi:hypothetical protein D3C80_1320180 [compost metagenome]
MRLRYHFDPTLNGKFDGVTEEIGQHLFHRLRIEPQRLRFFQAVIDRQPQVFQRGPPFKTTDRRS